MKKQRIIIIGSRGQLGRCFREVALHKENKNRFFVFWDIDELDITQKEKVVRACKVWQNDASLYSSTIVVNCAAYTQVDRAEEEPELCYSINSWAPEILCEELNSRGMGLIQISSDYVFDGTSEAPYLEDAPMRPLSVYGNSKKDCEERLQKRMCPGQTLIVRTQWLYSYWENNFVSKMISLAAEREVLSVVNDQDGSPTYAPSLVDALLSIAESYDREGQFRISLLHYSAQGVISWFDLAQAAIDVYYRGDIPCSVLPITTEQYPTLAQRPRYSPLSKERLKDVYLIEPLDWKTDLIACCQEISIRKEK